MRNLKEFTDEELFQDVRLNKKDAFDELFDRFWYPLYRSCYKAIKSHEESEEIVQDLLVTIWSHRHKTNILHVSSYLFSSVKRRIIDRVRSKITQEKYWKYYKEYIPTYCNTTDQLVDFNDLHKEIDLIINTLPQKSQQVFRMNRLEGQSISEISKTMHLPKRTIEYHLTKSLRALRVHLKDSIVSVLIAANIFLF